MLKRISIRYLPFADAASDDFPLRELLRLSLFQVSVGMAAVLLLGTLNRVMIVELYARLTDRPLSAMPPTLEESPIVTERLIRIYGQLDGSARVLGVDGNLIADYSNTEGGFIAGIYRVLERERGAIGAQASDPIRLVRFSDGRLGLRDDLTDFRAELFDFGADNEAAFARLLEE